MLWISEQSANCRHLKALFFANLSNQFMWYAYLKAAWRGLTTTLLSRWFGKLTFKATAKGEKPSLTLCCTHSLFSSEPTGTLPSRSAHFCKSSPPLKAARSRLNDMTDTARLSGSCRLSERDKLLLLVWIGQSISSSLQERRSWQLPHYVTSGFTL